MLPNGLKECRMELDERVTVVPYDARWPVWFEELKARLERYRKNT